MNAEQIVLLGLLKEPKVRPIYKGHALPYRGYLLRVSSKHFDGRLLRIKSADEECLNYQMQVLLKSDKVTVILMEKKSAFCASH